MGLRQIILECDEDDYRDIQAEIARQQRYAHQHGGEPCYPEGESNIAGICIGEACRSLAEYRSMYDQEHPR